MAKRKYVRASVVSPVVTDAAIIPVAGDATPNAIQAGRPSQDNGHVAEGAEQFPTDPPMGPQHDHTTPDLVMSTFLDGATHFEGSNGVPTGVIEVFGDVRHTSTESLIDYARRIEAQAQPLAVCQITHPDAKDGAVHEGTYAGIRLVRGDELSARLSDGTSL